MEFPAEREAIEEELKKLPGHRQNAPLRQWQTSWTLDDLRVRVAKADALIAEGVLNPRSLSIGATRVWTTGEILTAANMNLYISQVLDDLAGRNGLIELEDSLSLPAGDSALVLPGGTTAQRPSSPQTGMMRFNTTNDDMEVYRGSVHGWTRIPTDEVTFNQLNSLGLVGTGSGQFAVGTHGHNIATLNPCASTIGNVSYPMSNTYSNRSSFAVSGVAGTEEGLFVSVVLTLPANFWNVRVNVDTLDIQIRKGTVVLGTYSKTSSADGLGRLRGLLRPFT